MHMPVNNSILSKDAETGVGGAASSGPEQMPVMGDGALQGANVRMHDEECLNEFEIVSEKEYSHMQALLKDDWVQFALTWLKENLLNPTNEQLIQNGSMKRFISQEALDLRHALQILCLYHVFNIVFANISIFMKLCDLCFMYLTLFSSLELSKVHIVGYTVSTSILICIGLSHLPYFRNFRSTFAYTYFAFELLLLALGTLLVLHFLQLHVLNQEVIRVANDNRKNRYNINKQIQR
jgi:hypothetical protein